MFCNVKNVSLLILWAVFLVCTFGKWVLFFVFFVDRFYFFIDLLFKYDHVMELLCLCTNTSILTNHKSICTFSIINSNVINVISFQESYLYWSNFTMLLSPLSVFSVICRWSYLFSTSSVCFYKSLAKIPSATGLCYLTVCLISMKTYHRLQAQMILAEPPSIPLCPLVSFGCGGGRH